MLQLIDKYKEQVTHEDRWEIAAVSWDRVTACLSSHIGLCSLCCPTWGSIKKKYGIIWEFFPTQRGGGGGLNPKTLSP